MRTLIITFLLLCVSAICNAQKSDSRSIFSPQNHLTFYLLDVEDGLSNNYINHIEQDSLGFIWIATTDGLNRYDGHKFEIYRKSNLNPNSGPAANYIEHLEIAKDQKLLLATYKGLSEYDLKMDSFNHLDGSSQNSISYVINRPNGTKILANYEGGVAITKADSVVAFFSHSPEDPNSL